MKKLITVDFFKKKISGFEWTEKFQDVHEMEKAVLKYIKLKQKELDSWGRPFIFKKVVLKTKF